jgi:ubiquinone/menaquinone biosynthesis C-methylase UbiE
MFPGTSMPDRNWWQELWPNPKETIAKFRIDNNSRILDLCCGDGYFTPFLAENASELIGIELDAALLDQCKEEVRRNGLTNCEFFVEDAMNLSILLRDPVDVFIGNTFHGIPDKHALSQQVHNVLKPGGLFIQLNWHKMDRVETVVLNQSRGPKTELRMSPEEVSEVVTPVGFTRKELIQFPPFHYGIIFMRD